MRQISYIKKDSIVTILLVSLLLTIGLTGCSTIVLHPIDQKDIVFMPSGSSYKCDRDGYFLSKFYMDEVEKAKVERKRPK